MLTATAAAAALGLSRRKVYALAAAGELRHYRFGQAVRFDPADLQAFKAASCRSAGTRATSAGASNSTASLRVAVTMRSLDVGVVGCWRV